MTLKDAITQADNMRPNAIDDTVKAGFIYQLEGEFAEIMGVPVPENAFDAAEDDPTLLMPYPKDHCYVYYCAAMIDHYNSDMDLYRNDMELANQARADAMAWWRRHHTPEKCGNWRTMPL